MKRITEDIKTGDFKRIYLIYGEEEYLCRMNKNKLLKALGVYDDSMNFTKFEGSQISEEQIIDTCETLPFFADRRVILIEDSGFLKEKKEKLPDYLADPPEYAVIIFYEKEIDKRNRLYKAIAKYDRVIEIKKPDEKELTNWILVELKRSNKVIKKSTLEFFLSGSGTDMNFISCELEKLISYTGERKEITADDVKAVCTFQVENRIFDMISDRASGNKEKALKEYYDLLLLKEPPMRILFLLARQYDQLLRIKDLADQGMGEKLIAETLKIHPYAVKKNRPLAMKYSRDELKCALEECVRAEEDVKTGKMADKLSVELLLV